MIRQGAPTASPLLASLLFVLGPLVTGCGPGEDAPSREMPRMGTSGSMAALATDTTALRRLHDSIDTSHDHLMSRYGELEARMPPEAAELYRTMEPMTGMTRDMHGRMMSVMHRRGMMGPGMMHEAMTGEMPMAREWDWQMETMHQEMAAYMAELGFDEMAEIHTSMAGLYGRARRSLEAEGDEEMAAPEAPEGEISGEAVYQQACSSCHGPQGGGRAGIFPPVAGSSWVSGVPETPIRIVLHGLEGPVEVDGRTYDGVMPSFGARLSDGEVAAVLSHVRTSWAGASEVTAEAVSSVRREYRSRSRPWTASELR